MTVNALHPSPTLADDGYDPSGQWLGSVPAICSGAKCIQSDGKGDGEGTLTIDSWDPASGVLGGTFEDGTPFTGQISGSSVTLAAESDGIRLAAEMSISADGSTWSGGVRYIEAATNIEITGDLTMTRLGPAPGSDATADPVFTLLEILGPGWSAATSDKPLCDCGDPVNPASGNLSLQQTDATVPGLGIGLELQRTYNSMAAAKTGRFGAGWTDSYAAHLSTTGPSVTVWLGSGASVPFMVSGDGFTAPAWVTASLAHGADGGWVVTFADRSAMTFDVAGHLISLSDRTGESTTLGYDTNGLLASATDPSGRLMSFASDALGRITDLTDPAGRTVSYRYDDAGDLAEVTDVAGGITRYGYDVQHRMTSTTDPAGRTATTSYDDAGRVIDQVDPAGHHLGFAYAGAFPDLSTTITNGNGVNDVFAYHGGVLVSATRAAGTSAEGTTRYTYDPHLALASVTDPNGHMWTFANDAAGNVTSATDPLGRTTTTTYSQLNDPTKITDPAGVVTTVDYDSNGLAIRTVRAVGTSAEATILIRRNDPKHPGEVTGVVDPVGAATTYRYNPFGNIVGETDAAGGVSTATYDQLGRETSTVGPLGNMQGADPSSDRTTYTYDAYGSVTTVIDPQGHTATAAYDDVGNLTSSTDAAGHVTSVVYDSTGRPTSTTYADGTSSAVAYDAVGNVLRQVDTAGTTTTFAYDPRDRLATRTDAAGHVWTRGYDPAGNVVAVTDPMGRATHFAYDPAGQLTGISYDDAATTPVTYSYDALGRRSSMTDASGTTRYRYDEQSRLVAVTDGAGRTVARTYDPRGDVTTMTYPSGLKVGHTYDPVGRLAVVGDGLGHDNTFTYDAAGNMTGAALGDGTHTSLTFDRDGAALSLIDATASGSRWASFAVTRDPIEQIAAVVDTMPGSAAGGSVAATYDARQHLTKFGVQAYSIDRSGWLTGIGARTLAHDPLGQLTNDGTSTYAFDPNGRRTTATGPAGVTTYGFDQAGRLVALAIPTALTAASDTAAARSANGNGGGATILILVLASVAAFAAAAVFIARRKRSRSVSNIGMILLLTLASVSVMARTATPTHAVATTPDGATAAATYTYNGDGLRVGTVNTDKTTATFTWDQVDTQPILLGDGTDQFIVGPAGMPLEQVDSTGTPTWLHADLQGTVRALTDASGTVIATYTYDTYGQLVAHTGPANSRIGWQGQYADAGTGLHYLIARYYDPNTAQFLTSDPLADSTGQPYNYAANNPLNSSDAAGLAPTPWFPVSAAKSSSPWYSPTADVLMPFTVLAGHGTMNGDTFNVPDGTWVHFHAPAGSTITDRLGVAIESGHPTQYNEIYGPGDLVDEHVLGPPYGLDVLLTSTTVKSNSRMSALLKPNQGHVHWAACRQTYFKTETPGSEALRARLAARGYAGSSWHTTGPVWRDHNDPRYYHVGGPRQ